MKIAKWRISNFLKHFKTFQMIPMNFDQAIWSTDPQAGQGRTGPDRAGQDRAGLGRAGFMAV